LKDGRVSPTQSKQNISKARFLGMTWYNVVFHGDDGHANTKPMWGRRDTLAASARLINELENLAYEMNGYTTTTGIHSHPFGSCNIQSKTKVIFCLMHKETEGLEAMGKEIEKRIKSIAGQRGLEFDLARDIHLLPGEFVSPSLNSILLRIITAPSGPKLSTA
jgi:N-carbamoyl-L-amino-acid hydrolase